MIFEGPFHSGLFYVYAVPFYICCCFSLKLSRFLGDYESTWPIEAHYVIISHPPKEK